MEALTLTHHPHPILPAAGRRVWPHAWRAGQTVREVLLAQGLDAHQEIVIGLNDRLLPVAEWDVVCPVPGDLINIQVAVSGGGDDGSNPLQIVAMIALMVVANVYGAQLGAAIFGGASATATAVGTALISVAGSMVIGAIFKPAAPDLGRAAMSQAASPTYSLAGGRNAARPYEPMPLVMGVHRMYPDLAARPYTELVGDDQYLYQIFHFGLSDVVISDYRIGATPIEDFDGVTFYTPDVDGYLTAFPGNVDTIPGGELVSAAAGGGDWVERTGSDNTVTIAADIELMCFYADTNRGPTPVTGTVELEYAVSGSGVWLPLAYEAISNNALNKTQRRSYRLNVAKGRYDVRARLVSVITYQGVDMGGKAINGGGYSCNFAQLRSYQEDTQAYPNQNRIGLRIKASGQLNGTLDTISANVSARCLVWNGSAWVSAATSNPAWWFLDFARGRRTPDDTLTYGVGLADAQIDIEGIKVWGAFCDAQGLSFNAVIDRRQSCADVLTMISRCGLASVSWASGTLGAVWDAANAEPVMVFGMSNIAKGSFEVTYNSENLAEEIIVRFVDASRDWQQEEVRVTVPGVSVPTRTSSVDLMGCTNATMAGKFANVLAAQQYYRRRNITWETDFEGFVCQRGDVVLLSHDLTQWGYSGRIVAVAGNDITLDRAVPRSDGVNDYLMIRQPDGTLTTYTVAVGTGDASVLTLTATPTLQAGQDLINHLWLYSPLPTPGKRVKIVSVAPVSESRVRLVATDEDPAFYAAWDGAWTQAGDDSLLEDITPQITRIEIAESLVRLNMGRVGSRVTVNITVDRAFDRINARWRIAGGSWVTLELIHPDFTLETESAGLLEVEARPVFGALIGTAFASSATVFGKTLPPANVAGFALAAIAGAAHVAWYPTQDLDVEMGGYLRIRHSPNLVSADWSNATDIGPQIPGTATSAVLPLLAGTYLAKWVDSLGIESVAATSIITDAANVASSNAVAERPQHPDFTGTRTGCAVVDDYLMLDSVETIGEQLGNISTWPRISALGGIQAEATYLFDSHIDLGSVQTARLSALIESLGVDQLDLISERGLVSTWAAVGGALVTDVSCTVYVRTTSDDPGASPVWSAWQPLVVGDYSARAYEFKAVIASASLTHNIHVTGLSVTVDMPDRVAADDDLVSGAGTYSATFALPFMAVPALGITAQNMATGDYYTISNKTAQGFDIVFRNAGGSAVSRTFDYLARGY